MRKIALSTAIMAFLCLQTYGQNIVRVGNSEDVDTNHQQGFLLMGGGGDNYDGLDWFYALTQGGDVVVIRFDTGLGYNDDFEQSSVEMNSYTTIESINTIEKANSPEVEETVRNAEALFIVGGNQKNYYNTWKDTKLHEALQYLIHDKKASIGGTSAGLAVLGEILYTAQNNTVFSSEALENPFNHRMTLADDFLNIPILENLVTDSHYDRLEDDDKNRHGRHFTFLARILHDRETDIAKGIGVDEYTAVGIDHTGIARVFGASNHDDNAYFLQSVSNPEIIEDGTPLTWYNDKNAVFVYKVKGDKQGSRTFDLNDWMTGQDGTWHKWYAQEGVLNQIDATEEEIMEILDETTGLENAGAGSSIYPNPAQNQISIRSSENIEKIELWNTQAQKVLAKNALHKQEVTLNTQILPEGMYFLRIQYRGGKQETQKLLIKH